MKQLKITNEFIEDESANVTYEFFCNEISKYINKFTNDNKKIIVNLFSLNNFNSTISKYKESNYEYNNKLNNASIYHIKRF